VSRDGKEKKGILKKAAKDGFFEEDGTNI